MIATRRRPFRLPVMAFVKTLAFFAVIYVLVRVPFTHALIFDGPAKPVWTQAAALEARYLAPSIDPVIEPITAANLVRKVGERNTEIIALKKQVRDLRYEQKLRTKQINDLQKHAPAKPVAAAAATAATGSALTVASPNDQASAGTTAPIVQTTPSPDEAKTAAYWGAMEAENAASVAQKLDPQQTARIFLALKADQVAEIMNALPADYNVRLQQVRLTYPKPAMP